MNLQQIMTLKNLTLTIPLLRIQLYDFQKQGVAAMYFTKKIICGSQTGLGKTILSVALVSLLSGKEEIRPNETLIIVPNSMRLDWFNAFKQASYLKPIVGKTEDRACRYLKTRNNALILGYSTVSNRMNFLEKHPFKLIICDESSYIKNTETQLFKNIKILTNKADRVVLLNATSIENSIQDFYASADICSPGMFGSYQNFISNYASTEEHYFRTKYKTLKSTTVVTGIKSLESLAQLKQQMSSFYFRHEYKDCEKELPERIIKNIMVELKDCQKIEYANQIALFKAKKIKGASLLYSLLRITEGKLNDWEKMDRPETVSSKAEAVIDLINSFCGEQFVIFSPYISQLLALGKIIKNLGLKPGFFTGVNEDTRDAHSEEFINKKRDCLLVSMAGSRGKSWQNARHLIMFTQTYNPSLTHQVQSRIHRLTSDYKSIFIYNIIAEDTIEENVLALLERKSTLANYVNEDGTGLDNLSDNQINTLLSKRISLINPDQLDVQFNDISRELSKI